MKNKLLKAFTLLLFTSLIIGFVAYRAGYFDTYRFHYSGSSNGGTMNNAKDTTEQVDSIKRIEMMSSSKTIILNNQKTKVITQDTTKVKVDSFYIDKTYMWSSKSAYIVDTTDVKKILETETIQKK